MPLRVVFDTNTVVSALLFANGRLAWLRAHWQSGSAVPLASRETVGELTRVLNYSKFQLSTEDRHELLAEYLPFCEIVEPDSALDIQCRDPADQKFLDLAKSGKADLLVTGDADLLVLARYVDLVIERPSEYRDRIARQMDDVEP